MDKLFPKREFSKSKMSMYLRTLCERELYLSLFSNDPTELEKATLPIPLKSRPGVQLITASGHEFEYEQYNVLMQFSSEQRALLEAALPAPLAAGCPSPARCPGSGHSVLSKILADMTKGPTAELQIT